MNIRLFYLLMLRLINSVYTGILMTLYRLSPGRNPDNS